MDVGTRAGVRSAVEVTGGAPCAAELPPRRVQCVRGTLHLPGRQIFNFFAWEMNLCGAGHGLPQTSW